MKVIAYSIFRAPCEKFEFMAYLRGIYFNTRMNKLIYPDWHTMIYSSKEILDKYYTFWVGLGEINDNITVIESDDNVPICKGMLWRMEPVFINDITHVICRDADALTSYREAQSVNLWLKSGKDAHVIHDNPAHGGLMGGMVGFRTDRFRELFPKWKSLNDMTRGWDLSKRGSDQDLLNKLVLPIVKDSLYAADLQAIRPYTHPGTTNDDHGVNKKFWESNLCSAFIGSAGVNEMETLRFFKRFDKTDYSEFEKEHSDICYWARN